jgi:hypothetical protein
MDGVGVPPKKWGAFGRVFSLMRGLGVVFEFFFGLEELLASWANICSL